MSATLPGPAHSNPNSLETLCFIPSEIGTSTRWSESYKNPYRCLLSLPTEHGMVHAQKSGLQEIAKVSARRVLNLTCIYLTSPSPCHLFTHSTGYSQRYQIPWANSKIARAAEWPSRLASAPKALRFKLP